MPLLGASVVFLSLIAVLGVLRTRILFEFTSITLLSFNSSNLGKWLYTLLFLPGTILHELSHWLVAELLGVRTGEITILPTTDDDTTRQKLGSVQTAASGPLRSFLIGAAPFLTGLLTLYLLGTLLLSAELWWHYLLLFYGIVVTGSCMLLSREDRRSWPFIGILLTTLLALFYVIPIKIPPTLIFSLARTIWRLNQVLAVTVLAILTLIALSYGLRRIIEKLVHKQVVVRRKI